MGEAFETGGLLVGELLGEELMGGGLLEGSLCLPILLTGSSPMTECEVAGMR